MGDRENNRIQIFSQSGSYLMSGPIRSSQRLVHHSGRQALCGRFESGPDTGAGELTGIMKGIRIGSAIDGTVHSFIEDLEPLRDDHSGAEGVGVEGR